MAQPNRQEGLRPLREPIPLRPVNGLSDRPPSSSTSLLRHPYVVGALAGVLGAAVITLVELILQLSFKMEFSFELLLGTLVSGRVDASSWALGFAWHLTNGAIFGLAYAFFFRLLSRSGAALGTTFGMIHWVAGGFLIGVLSSVNPYVPALIPPTGFYASAFGSGEMLELLALHLLFGAIVGASYRASVIPAR